MVKSETKDDKNIKIIQTYKYLPYKIGSKNCLILLY